MMMNIPFSLTGVFFVYIYNIFHSINSVQKYTKKLIEASLDLSVM